MLQYRRILAFGRMRTICTCTLVVVGAWCISQLLVAMFTCSPVDGFWDKTVPARCVPSHPWWEINAAGNIITDVAILTLPIPILAKLILPRPQKIALIGIFSLGFL